MKEILSYAIENRTLQKLTLSKCVDTDILRTTGRLIEMKGILYLALESSYKNGKVIQKNKILINYIVSDSSSFVKEKDAYFLTILIQIIKGENNDK